MPHIAPLIRLPVFVALLVFSLIVLGCDGHIVNKTSGTVDVGFGITYHFTAPAWAKLGIATSVLTLVSLIPMLVIDLMRRGAPTSWVAVELGWLGFLWIMWLATAADTANNVNCDGDSDGLCGPAQAGEAFSFLAWIVLMAYWVLLLVFSILTHNKGNQGIWRSSVRDAEWSGGAGGVGTGPVHHTGAASEGPAMTDKATYPPTNV